MKVNYLFPPLILLHIPPPPRRTQSLSAPPADNHVFDRKLRALIDSPVSACVRVRACMRVRACVRVRGSRTPRIASFRSSVRPHRSPALGRPPSVTRGVCLRLEPPVDLHQRFYY